MAEDQKATNSIHLTWDEGLTWDNFQISKEKFEVTNIINDPDN